MKRQTGFTLIELIIVVIILGLLAATALPRFLNVTEQAEDASIQGIAGGFASAVGLVRAQWEVEGRPNGNNGTNITEVLYDTVEIGVDGTIGYASANPNGAGDTLVTTVTVEDCLYLIDNMFQQQLNTSTTFANNLQLFVRVDNNVCFYHQTDGLTTAPTSTAGNNGFSYNAATGQVDIFLNKV